MKLDLTCFRQCTLRLLAAGTVALTVPAVGTAQAQTSGLCAVRDRSEAIVVMVCPRELSATQWRAAAERACGDRQMCNVWIWDDAGRAPDKAPTTDAGIPRTSAAVAVAVWANDSKSLMRLRSAP